MGLNNKSTLKTAAQLIRHEKGEGKNTAERVGKALEDLVDAVDVSLTTETDARTSKDNALESTLSSTVTIANNALDIANKAKTAADTAKTTADTANATANAAKAVTDTVGKPYGLATLDGSKRIPSSQLPGYVDDVVEFNAMVDGITTQINPAPYSSTDVGCMVVYDRVNCVFLLAVSLKRDYTLSEWDSLKRPTNITDVPLAHTDLFEKTSPWIILDNQTLLDISLFTYYRDWKDTDSFGEHTQEGYCVPESGKVYICTSDNKTFRWSGSDLVTIGSDLALGYTSSSAYPGDEGAAIAKLAEGVQIFPFDIQMYRLSEDRGYPVGYIAYVVSEGLFYQKGENGTWSIISSYHNSDRYGYEHFPKTDVIFREGRQLYVAEEYDTNKYHLVAYAIGDNKLTDLSARVSGIAIFPVDEIRSNAGSSLVKTGIVICHDGDGRYWAEAEWPISGYDYFDYNFEYDDPESGNCYPVLRKGRIYRCDEDLYRYDGKAMQKIGGSSIGNMYNVTVEIPLSSGEYYSDLLADEQPHNVLQAVHKAGKATLGMSITFAIGPSSWKTYQYVGPNTTEDQFVKKPKENWVDLAGMSAGAESIINVDVLCPREVVGYYTLGSAIDALLKKQQESGIKYAKQGLILTFRTDEYVFEAHQFIGEDADGDFTKQTLWKSFGAGGSQVECKGEPESGGTDAFSTGGAFDMRQQAFDHLDLDQDADKYFINAVNRNGDKMGTSIELPKSTGNGSQSGTSLNLFLEDAAPAMAFGSQIIVRAAIRSVTYVGQDEIPNPIRYMGIIDATSGLPLWESNINEASSTSATNYKFEYDLTPYFTDAAEKDFTLVARDSDGNEKRRTITVAAVDVTCSCKQTLNHSASSVLEVSGRAKPLTMYSFEKNVSKQGVKVFTDIYLDGEWQRLGEAVVLDTYSHSISIDPMNCLGKQLTHGSYALRIQGEDVKSGVKGNTIITSVMVVDPTNSTPIVSLRYNDVNNGTIRLYDNLEVIVAAYTPGKTSTQAEILLDGVVISTVDLSPSATQTIHKQVQGYSADGTKTLHLNARSGAVETVPEIEVRVVGSAIDAVLKEGALFGYDFATRSNAETDHTIENNGYEMSVVGSNWSSNGFVPYLGEQSLRIAENVTAHIPYAPFGSSATERSQGMALQFAFATNNAKDPEARLMECMGDTGTGFYLCGNKLVVNCASGSPKTITRSFRSGEKHTLAIVVEPSTKVVSRGETQYSTIKVYMDGEEISAIGYVANSGAILNPSTIKFNGTEGDFYLYYMLAYDSYYEWSQAFQNYLVKLTDTTAMIGEYNKEAVLDAQNRPTREKLEAAGIPYYVIVASQETFDSFDSDIDTKKNFLCDLYYYHPTMPWRSFKAKNVRWRRQGTTSAKRPIKNDRFYLRKEKNWEVTPIYPLENFPNNADAQKTYELFKIGYVRVDENSFPVAIITTKVDYSDSSMANDCGVCDMMNATFRALGTDYLTPAQRAHDGTWRNGDVAVSGLEMNHSTANHPIAVFRATQDNMTDAWFHARGNWKEDKGEQVALGFKDTPGYNKGCLNYGDFVEFFANKGETLDQAMARFKSTEGLDTSKVYLISEYCGRNYRFMRFSGGEWARSTGSMKQVNGKWVITGDVLNPVSGYELITYDAMDWFMGVGSVEDMMAPVDAASSWVDKLNLKQPTYPAWTQYFECMVDDDQLQVDLAMGRKVPYELFNVLRFCDSCDYSKSSLSSTWKKIWSENAWKYMSIQSLMAYYTFTDYLAAVDQQAKNMQPMFFLEDGCSVLNGEYSGINGMEPLRMYFNKVYDCDTCNGKDNDGGNTIPATLDPEQDDKCYAGRGSILWNNLRRCTDQSMIYGLDNNGKLASLTLPGVVAEMRNLPEVSGIGAGPFSPKGAMHYFVNKRIMEWPKVVCTYDCERKYIGYTGYNDIYYYALHGSGRQSLPAFIDERWRVRDGYYKTGDFKDASHVLGGRIGAKTGAIIKFRAAKDGYFGIGNDGGNVTQGMYLRAGEEGIFTDFQHGDNVLLYIYQADQMSEIDLSQISLDPNFQFSIMRMAEKIVIGSTNHRTAWKLSTGNTGFLETMNLGSLPFLRHLDVRTTEISTIDATMCPRLETVLAEGSELSSLKLAETSPVSTLQLTDKMSELNLVNLPKLTYPGGLTLAGTGKVTRLMLAGCPYVDPYALFMDVVQGGNIKQIRLPNVNITAPSSILTQLKANGAIGLDQTGTAYEESGRCSGISGRWICEDLVSESDLATLAAYFPQLELHNSQYSYVIFDDHTPDEKGEDIGECENITNPENKTGYQYKNDFEPSGHFLKIFENAHAYKCEWDDREKKLRAAQILDTDYTKMADGTSFDPTDASGIGFDIMLGFGKYWYKGVNDFKNQRKYFFGSYGLTEPLSTSTRINRKKCGEILRQANAAIMTTGLNRGDDYEITDNANMSCYEMDVQGMKQVRWPGVNSAVVGAVFVDEDDKVVSTFNMAVTHPLFDFTLGDYIFCDVPSGAVKFIFTAPNLNKGTAMDTPIYNTSELECIAVDSNAIEAIEPDWVDCRKLRFVGVYGMYIDALMKARSISGVKTRTGTGTQTTNPDWKYDKEGELTNTTVPVSTMYYTYCDILNLCLMRGEGFHAISYEISKDLANLIMALTGTRDIQALCGRGCGSQYTTGSQTINGKNINLLGKRTEPNGNSGNGNLMFGIQNFVGCNWEVMEYICANVNTYSSFRANKRLGITGDPVNARYHIHDPYTNTERVVQGINASGYCIGRVRFGRFCDTIASRVTSDTSLWNKHYSDGQWYSHSTGRCVGRSSNNANADGGLVYSYANYASSNSYAYVGSRLAFSGAYEIVE